MPAPEIIHWTHGAALLLHLPSMGAFRFKDSPILLEKKISEQRKEISKAAPGVRRGHFLMDESSECVIILLNENFT